MQDEERSKKMDQGTYGMVMQDAVDSAEIDMRTATRKSWYIEVG